MPFIPLEEVRKDFSASDLAEFNRVHLRDAHGKFTRMGSLYDAKARNAATVLEDKGVSQELTTAVKEHPRKEGAKAAAATVVAAVAIRNAVYVGKLARGSGKVHSYVDSSVPRPHSHGTRGLNESLFGFDIRGAQQRDQSDMASQLAEGLSSRGTRAYDKFRAKDYTGTRDELQGFRGLKKLPRGRVEGKGYRNFEASSFTAHSIRPRTSGSIQDALTGSAYSPKAYKHLYGKNGEETLRNLERAIKNSPTENSFVIEPGINKIISGSAGHTVMTPMWIPDDYDMVGKTLILTHNHPHLSDHQVRGFSPGDFGVLRAAVKEGATKNTTFRAIYADGTAEEIVITDWRKFDRFVKSLNGVVGIKAQKAMAAAASGGNSEHLIDVLLQAQADVQKYAHESGKYGFKIVEHTEFAKRMMSQKELNHRKKLQSGIAVTTSTLGLTALGLKGGAIKAGRSAARLDKISQVRTVPEGLQNRHKLKAELLHRRAKKLDSAAVNTSLTAGGIGGVGGYNFASYTRAEGNQKKRIKKNWEPAMDFGLNSVHQGEEIAKKDWKNIEEHKRRAQDSRRRRRNSSNAAGLGLGVALASQGSANAKGINLTGEASNVARSLKNTGANLAMSHKNHTGQYGKTYRKAQFRTMKTIATKQPHGTAALAGLGLAGVAGTAAVGHRITEQGHNRAIARQRKARVKKSMSAPKFNFKLPGDPAKMTVKGQTTGHLQAPKKPMTTKKKVLIGAGSLTAVGAGGTAAYRHQKADSSGPTPGQRNFAVNRTGVGKAYDPERNRSNRLKRYEQATMFGAGATGAAALHQGHGAIGRPAHEKWKTKGSTSTKVKVAGTGLHSSSGAAVRGSFKKLGRAGGLGLAATGLAVGSSRINSYRKGRGRSYSQMRSIGY